MRKSKEKEVVPILDDYTKKLLRENIDFLNRKNVYRAVLEKHGLLKDANKLLHDLMPDCYDSNGEPIEIKEN